MSGYGRRVANEHTPRPPASSPRRRPGLVEQWRSYGDRHPIERWVSRASMVVGLVVVVALVALAFKWGVHWFLRTWGSV